MNILYISNLSTNIAAGLNWSVPAGVNAQSKIDNVLWVNLTDVCMPHWKNVAAYHNASEFGGFALENLPQPFDNPDVVVFEGFYHIKDPKIAKQLRSNGIPYVIIPRSAFTRQAQHMNWKKRLKKMVANLLIFSPYAKSAIAIQYLTKAEQSDSGSRWNKNSFVIPNGFNTPDKQKSNFSEKGLNAVFIGRIDSYQKGLDELLDACNIEQDFLRKSGFTLEIYGPKRYDFYAIGEYIEKHRIGDFVSLHNEIGGKEKEAKLLESDLFVLTSRFEGHPMGLVEALAYGMPVLVTPGSNMAEEIADSDSGWVCKTEAKSIAETLKEILNNRDNLTTKGMNARQLSKEYNWDNLAEKFHENLKELLKTNKG